MKNNKFSIPADVAKKIEEDAKAQQEKLKPILDELDKLPPGHTKEDAFDAFFTGLKKLK